VALNMSKEKQGEPNGQRQTLPAERKGKSRLKAPQEGGQAERSGAKREALEKEAKGRLHRLGLSRRRKVTAIGRRK